MIKISLNRMARILGVKTPDDFMELLCESGGETYSATYRQMMLDGDYSEEEAMEKAQEAEDRERDEAYERYVSSLVFCFQQEAENLKLDVTALKTRPGFYALTPTEGWSASAVKTRSIVYGIGGFWFESLKEFLRSGPYTPRKAVDQHLGYLGDQWKLYGYASPERRVHA